MRHPQVDKEQIYRDLSNPAVSSIEPDRVRQLVTVFTDPYEAASSTHAIVLLTEWDAFKVLIRAAGLLLVRAYLGLRCNQPRIYVSSQSVYRIEMLIPGCRVVESVGM